MNTVAARNAILAAAVAIALAFGMLGMGGVAHAATWSGNGNGGNWGGNHGSGNWNGGNGNWGGGNWNRGGWNRGGNNWRNNWGLGGFYGLSYPYLYGGYGYGLGTNCYSWYWNGYTWVQYYSCGYY